MDNEKAPQKIWKDKDVHRKQFNNPVKWKDIKDFNFEDEDVISIGYDEGYYSENNSWDPHYYINVSRKIIETDEQFKERIDRATRDKERYKKERYERYLKLKAEFEPEGN